MTWAVQASEWTPTSAVLPSDENAHSRSRRARRCCCHGSARGQWKGEDAVWMGARGGFTGTGRRDVRLVLCRVRDCAGGGIPAGMRRASMDVEGRGLCYQTAADASRLGCCSRCSGTLALLCVAVSSPEGIVSRTKFDDNLRTVRTQVATYTDTTWING